MDNDALADLIDQAMRHAHGEGPAPDLAAVDPADRDEAFDVVQLVDALAFARPPEEDQDRVLAGLRSMLRPDSDRQSSVQDAIDDLAFRHPDSVTVEAVDDPLPVSEMQSLFVCSALAERVLIVGMAGIGASDTSAARPLFDEDPGLTAVMLYDAETGDASLVANSDCRKRLVPGVGTVEPDQLVWEDPSLLLQRHFEVVLPSWEPIDRLDAGLELGAGIEETVQRVSASLLSEIAGSRPRLPHTRAARDFVVGVDKTDLMVLVHDVRARRASAGDCVDRVVAMCRDGAS